MTDITDDQLVRVYVKMRNARSVLRHNYEEEDDKLKEQMAQVSNELLRRLNDRGSTQTQTPDGTAYVGEDMQVTIADQDEFRKFVLTAQDLNWYVARVKVEHLREYMKVNAGRMPPGLNVFRERVVKVRAPRSKQEKGGTEVQPFEQPLSSGGWE